ncbi:MAG: hypothetical protein ABUL62_32030 [Myxococcales bacterium]
MASGLDEARQQVLANLSALPHQASFGEHRRRLTAAALDAAGARPAPSLCVLGAGNCFDLDLDALASRFGAIHLIDLDASALERAFERQSSATRSRLVLHAPIDLSGLLDRIDRWWRFQVTPAELMAHPAQIAGQIQAKLGLRFDVALSSCMLSQMHLSMLNVLTERHPLFDAVHLVLNLTHFHTLAELVHTGGCALLATDVSSNVLHTLDAHLPGADCRPLLVELVNLGKVFAFADPTRVGAQLSEDPSLRFAFAAPELRDAWVWDNGPDTKFLVYAASLQRL